MLPIGSVGSDTARSYQGSVAPVISFAPGRVNLIGEHTDYSGGLVLPVAIQYGVTVEVHGTTPTLELASDKPGWERYAAAVGEELGLLGRPDVWIRGTISSDLPIGAGLSSSAALEVAIANALCAVADFELEPFALAQACQRAELRAVGVPCGILDQAASVLGRKGEALLLDCGTLEHRYVHVPEGAALVIVDSGISHSHESSGYADRRRELEAGMARRVRHVETENQRVLDFAAALEANDLAAAGELLVASHASLRDDYEVSIPEIDALVEKALAAGAYGARIVGGGFGGSILALTDTAHADDLAARLGTSLIARASAGASVRA
jgi:galactokinase